MSVPITGGFLGNIVDAGGDPATAAVNFISVGKHFSLNEGIYYHLPLTSTCFVSNMQRLLPGQLQPDTDIPTTDNCKNTTQECTYTSDCCPSGVGDVPEDEIATCQDGYCASSPDVAGGILTAEPFCVAWSKPDSGSGAIDTFAFAPLFAWPPIAILGVVYLLPFCPGLYGLTGALTANCQFCDFISGFPILDFNIGPVPFKLTIQFDGIAVSWAETGKLAYGTNSATAGGGITGIEAPQVSLSN